MSWQSDHGEEALVRWLASHASPRIGDDAALLRGLKRAVVSVDSQHAGVHFPCDLDPAIAARRLLEVNLSDLAAMAAIPRYAFLSLAAPADYPRQRFLRSLIAGAKARGVELAGGDSSCLQVVSTTLTVIGELPRGARCLQRSAARPGAALWVGGTLGEAAVGLELVRRGARIRGRRVDLPHDVVPGKLQPAARAAVRRQLQPRAQLELGQWLGRRRSAPAAIDLSDGLGKDLGRLCAMSGVGAVVEATALPYQDGHFELCAILRIDPLEVAIAAGEDYVLAFTLPSGTAPPASFGCTRIGRIVVGPGVQLEHADRTTAIGGLGWDHLEKKTTP